MSTYRDHAVVLGSHKFGEADRVVILLTKEHGKVRAVAKGVRKTKSSIGARLEPMSLVDISLRKGRDLDTVDQVRLVQPLTHLRGDFDRLRQGLSMVEAMNKVAPDREPVEHLYNLLTRALLFLDQQNSPLMLASFFWRLISLEGGMPQLHQCVHCGESDNLKYFDVLEGGVHCASCHQGLPISESALEIVRWIIGGRMNDALALEESTAVHEVNHLAMEAIEIHLERRLKSLGVFDRHL